MRTTIAKWGNSSAVRLPAELALSAGLTLGTPVRLERTEKGISIEPLKRRLTLDELLSNTPKDASVPGWDELAPVGDELL